MTAIIWAAILFCVVGLLVVGICACMVAGADDDRMGRGNHTWTVEDE